MRQLEIREPQTKMRPWAWKRYALRLEREHMLYMELVRQLKEDITRLRDGHEVTGRR